MAEYPVFAAKPDKERLMRTFHPWVFSGALVPRGSCTLSGEEILPGIARLDAADGSFLAWAQHNPGSKIRLRLCSARRDAPPDAAWLGRQLEQAFGLRCILDGSTDACRLVFAEGDGIPGVVIDRFADCLVVQLETAGADAWRPVLQQILPPLARRHVPGLAAILEHSDSDGRQLEGLAPRSETWWGSAPAGPVEIQESGCRLLVRPGSQKTGFYADQRDNRQLCARYASGQDVLDVCCYSGAFSVQAARAGARSLTLVDASAEALDLARHNLDLAGQPPEHRRCLEGDAWTVLRQLRKEDRRYGLVILDPPKLAPTRQSLEKALRGYKDLNLQGMNLVAPGGCLASFSCSGLVSAEELQTTLAWAAKDAGIHFQILHRLEQGLDHPVPLHFPEGRYLKGFLLRRVD